MITSLLRILSIHFWATGSTFLIETISLMLGIYLFWTSNTVNTRKKVWKKKQAIFYISFQKGQLSHCVFSQNLSETKKTRSLFYFQEIKKESSSHDQSARLSSGSLTSTKTICVTQGFFISPNTNSQKGNKTFKAMQRGGSWSWREDSYR